MSKTYDLKFTLSGTAEDMAARTAKALMASVDSITAQMAFLADTLGTDTFLELMEKVTRTAIECKDEYLDMAETVEKIQK